MSDVTAEQLAAQHAQLVEVSEALIEDSTERKESDRRSRRTTRWLILLTIIDTIALATVLYGLAVIRDYQAQGAERGARIEQTSSENHEILGILRCALQAGNEHPDNPIAQRVALNDCIKENT